MSGRYDNPETRQLLTSLLARFEALAKTMVDDEHLEPRLVLAAAAVMAGECVSRCQPARSRGALMAMGCTLLEEAAMHTGAGAIAETLLAVLAPQPKGVM